jgi:hypothetical protein
MSERPSMWSQMRRAIWLREAVCPECGEANIKGRTGLIELTDDGAYCNNCGKSWPVGREKAEPVQ